MVSIESWGVIPGDSNILIRGRIRFIDGSVLSVREFWSKGTLIKYSYYWFYPNGRLRIGWDNAPHHTKITTYPHHKHVKSKQNIVESHEHNLFSVLEYIRKAIL